MEPPDDELLALVMQSDVAAFRILFQRYYSLLYRQVWFKSGERDFTEDIIQETFVRLWIRRRSLKPSLSLFSYLTAISNNLLKDHYKHELIKARFRDSGFTPAPSAGDDPDDALQLSLLQERISAIVQSSFTDLCRAVFVLSRIEGKKNSEIAALLGINPKKVENRLYVALKILRKKLPAGK